MCVNQERAVGGFPFIRVPENVIQAELFERVSIHRMKLINALTINHFVALWRFFLVFRQPIIVCCNLAPYRILSSENNAFVSCETRSICFRLLQHTRAASKTFLLSFSRCFRLVCVAIMHEMKDVKRTKSHSIFIITLTGCGRHKLKEKAENSPFFCFVYREWSSIACMSAQINTRKKRYMRRTATVTGWQQ